MLVLHQLGAAGPGFSISSPRSLSHPLGLPTFFASDFSTLELCAGPGSGNPIGAPRFSHKHHLCAPGKAGAALMRLDLAANRSTQLTVCLRTQDRTELHY